MWIFVVMFFILMGLLIYALIRYVDERDNQREADEIVNKIEREREYRKPKKEDITDL